MCGTSEPVGRFLAEAVCRNAKYTLAFGHKNDILHIQPKRGRQRDRISLFYNDLYNGVLN